MKVILHGKTILLPDPLIDDAGNPILTAEAWTAQRAGVLELFRSHVYGRSPLERPERTGFDCHLETSAMAGAATLKRVNIRFTGPGGEGVIHLALFTPQAVTPAPCFLLLNNREPEVADPTRVFQTEFWPAEMLIARGYAAAVIQLSDIDPDVHDGFKNGVHGIFDPPQAQGQRAGDAWGTIGAWAWGASRVMDYLQTDSNIDSKRVAIIGHSRGGKAALWAGAQDTRFALVISNESGSTGAALSRGKHGETIADINTRFPHWFCANYTQYNHRESDMPVDQHALLALMAPRLLYVASASDDAWADPEAEYMAAVAATPVYRLFGLEGLAGALPLIEAPLHKGHIGHHIRRGGHDLTHYDWSQFLAFADRHMHT
jgi:dienelactone hydrolase